MPWFGPVAEVLSCCPYHEFCIGGSISRALMLTSEMWLLQVDGDLQCEPVCQCGLKFCFQCGLDPHSPCTCEM